LFGEDKPTEQWQPGKVEISKLSKGFSYLVATGFAPPPQLDHPPEPPDPPPLCTFAVPNKFTQKWIRRLQQHREAKKACYHDNKAIKGAIREAMFDSGASSSLIQSATGFKQTGPSDKQVITASGNILQAANKIELDIRNLPKAAKEAHVVPTMTPKASMSVKALADSRHTTIFHPYMQGVTVHAHNDIALTFFAVPVLQGWRDRKGLWMVPIVDDTPISPALDTADPAINVYELPTTKEVIRFLHAALRFPTKATLLTTAQNGKLVTFPGLTVENISKHFPELVETAKGHMKQSKRGMRSTKVIDEDIPQVKQTPGVKHKDVYLRVFDATKKSIYTDQMGKFPIQSS
jgi:hypothetical protein